MSVGISSQVVMHSACWAHLGTTVFPVYELPTSDMPDLRDGTMEDWHQALPGGSLSHNDFQYHEVGGPIDPSDLAVNAFLVWNHSSGAVCVGVERLDDVYFPNEAVGFDIDGDHSGGQYIYAGDAYSDEEVRRLSFSNAQAYAAYAEPPRGGSRLVVDPRLNWTTQSPFAEAGGWHLGSDPTYVAVEFCVTPFDVLRSDDSALSQRSVLAPGNFIGFQLSIADSDVFDRLDGIYTLAVPVVSERVSEGGASYVHYGFADNFVDGELIPCHVGDCSRDGGTAVVQDSWGRIKAGLR